MQRIASSSFRSYSTSFSLRAHNTTEFPWQIKQQTLRGWVTGLRSHRTHTYRTQSRLLSPRRFKLLSFSTAQGRHRPTSGILWVSNLTVLLTRIPTTPWGHGHHRVVGSELPSFMRMLQSIQIRNVFALLPIRFTPISQIRWSYKARCRMEEGESGRRANAWFLTSRTLQTSSKGGHGYSRDYRS